jgi:cytochrome c-type biogenesis protein CcmH/NrfF
MVQPTPSQPTSNAVEGRGRRLGSGAIASLSGKVTLDFLFWSFTWPLWLLTLIAALIGAVVWFGLGVMRRHRRRKARREARRD